MELKHPMQASEKTVPPNIVISSGNEANHFHLQDHTRQFPSTMLKAAKQAQAIAEQILNPCGSSRP